MAVSARINPNALVAAFNKEIDFNSDTIKVMLLTSSYTPSDAHDYVDDIVANEVVGTGYTAGGPTLGSATMAYVAANSWPTARANSTSYVVGQIVRPATGNGNLYQASVGGTSGGSIPTYPTNLGGSVTDGAVTWVNIGRGAVVLDGADISIGSSTITARYAYVYDSSPATNATRPLISLVDFGADVISSAGTFAITWAAEGIDAFAIA